MDPRCYFSTTWWRKARQQALDATKQRVRLKLLTREGGQGKPLMEPDGIAGHLTTLLRALNTRVLVLGLLPVDESRFPGSRAHFASVNAKLRDVASAEGAEFLDWGSGLAHDGLFYRDGFHPNLAGARALADILCSRLCQQ
jgi:lysophospholipase L1-like esterase